MRDASIPVEISAVILAVSPSTVQRDARRPTSTSANSTSKRPDRQRRSAIESAAQDVRHSVRASHGLIGAASLSKRYGLSRRECAAIKKREKREMEIERKAACKSVSILAPGIVRGFDAMHINCSDGKALWLVGADAAVPYRTSITTALTYDAESVIAALRADFEAHGPPLVLRWDRIASQRTPEVQEFLAAHDVMVLHGPPRYPRFYGQLERQNREHREWLDVLGPVSIAELEVAAATARTSLNALWARPTLDWCTAEEAWNARLRVDVDRRELRREVTARAQELVNHGVENLRANRLAIEAAFIDHKLLTITLGGRC